MLLHVDGDIVEIRPGEIFKSRRLLDIRYLEILDQPKPRSKPITRGRKKRLDASST
jgi:hypothetical protein